MSFTGMLNQSATIKTKTNNSLYGQPETTTSTGVTVRVEPTDKTIFDIDGREKVAKLRIFLLPSVTIKAGDLITYDGTDYEVIAMEDMYKGNGTLHHREALV